MVQAVVDFLELKKWLQSSSGKHYVLCDENTYQHCYEIFCDQIKYKIKPIVIKAGEAQKEILTCQFIWQTLIDDQASKDSVLINLGGGVIGDLGGFCASTYKRGIDFIQIPTTLLAQVDASVGGKLGIDFQGLKNHIGVFQLPKTVLIDPKFIDTLSIQQKKSGFAEIIKHCLIRDEQEWNVIRQQSFEELDLSKLIAHSVAIKEAVVLEDPKEAGLRKILNFGHTLGHAIETYLLDKGKRKILHGEAIAIGMIVEAFISHQRDLISLQELEEIESYLFENYGRVKLHPEEISKIVALTAQDKKNKGKEIRFSLLTGIGDCGYDIPVSALEMKKAILYYLN